MINQQRVRRIKNLIYAFLILVFFLPAVLAVALLFRVLSLENTLNAALTGESSIVSVENQNASGDFSVQPEGAAAPGEDQLIIPGGGVEYRPSETDILMPPTPSQPGDSGDATLPDPDSDDNGGIPADSETDQVPPASTGDLAQAVPDTAGSAVQGEPVAAPSPDGAGNQPQGDSPHWNEASNPGYADSPNTGLD